MRAPPTFRGDFINCARSKVRLRHSFFLIQILVSSIYLLFLACRLLNGALIMPVKLVAEQEIKVGEATVVEGPSSTTTFAAVFEDDGETGYF